MSSVRGGKAIALVQSGGIVERPYARTFVARRSNGGSATVTIGVRPYSDDATVPAADVCTCDAGQRGTRCYHVDAAHLVAHQTSPPVGELVRLLAGLRGRGTFSGPSDRVEELEAQADALLDALDVPRERVAGA